MPEGLFDQASRLPGVGEIVGGERSEKRRVLDAADSLRRNEQELRRSADVFQNRESARQIDFGARLRVAMLALVRHASLVNDLPKHIWIRRLCRGVAGHQSDE